MWREETWWPQPPVARWPRWGLPRETRTEMQVDPALLSWPTPFVRLNSQSGISVLADRLNDNLYPTASVRNAPEEWSIYRPVHMAPNPRRSLLESTLRVYVHLWRSNMPRGNLLRFTMAAAAVAMIAVWGGRGRPQNRPQRGAVAGRQEVGIDFGRCCRSRWQHLDIRSVRRK